MITQHCSMPINDPMATHRIIVAHPDLGYGVFGYYGEYVAHVVKRDIEKAGYSCRIERHSISTLTGIHPAITARNLGYI